MAYSKLPFSNPIPSAYASQSMPFPLRGRMLRDSLPTQPIELIRGMCPHGLSYSLNISNIILAIRSFRNRLSMYSWKHLSSFQWTTSFSSRNGRQQVLQTIRAIGQWWRSCKYRNQSTIVKNHFRRKKQPINMTTKNRFIAGPPSSPPLSIHIHPSHQ